MKTHTSSFKEQIKLIGKEIDSRITFGETVLGKDDLNAVTPSYQGAILKSVMKQLDIDSNVEIPIGTILKYEFGLKVNGEYEYINYGNYVVYSIEKQEDTNSYKITCYDKLLYSMLDYVKLPITYPISIRDYINSLSTVLGLKFANKNDTFANYDKQIQADLYDGLGYTFRDILDELAQVTASTICLNNNDELELRYITETGDTIDEEFLKDVNVNFGEKFGAVNTIVLSRSADSDSVYYPEVLPANPYEIKISDNQIMNGNDRADFLPDIYDKLNGLEFYTNDFVSTGICYYDLCDRYSVKIGDTTYSCVMFNDEVLVTQGLEENVYTELPEQTETDYKHASKDDRMINQVYLIVKKNEAEILAVINTTEQLQKEINPTKDESGSEIIIDDASNNPLTYLEVEGKSIQDGEPTPDAPVEIESVGYENEFDVETWVNSGNNSNYYSYSNGVLSINALDDRGLSRFVESEKVILPNGTYTISGYNANGLRVYNDGTDYPLVNQPTFEVTLGYVYLKFVSSTVVECQPIITKGSQSHSYIPYGKYGIEVETVGKNLLNTPYTVDNKLTETATRDDYFNVLNCYVKLKAGKTYTFSVESDGEYGTGANDTIEILLLKEPDYSYFIRMTDKICTFVPNQSGTYNIRYDINQNGKTHSFWNFYIAEESSFSGFEKFYEKSILLQLNAPLRSLPNGVKDIAYIKNNKLYVERHIGSVVLNGSEGWNKSSFSNDTYFCGYLANGFTSNIISDASGYNNRFKIGVYDSVLTEECMAIRPQLNVRILANRLTENSVEALKTWLSTHNTKVDYELSTPITEEYSEIEMIKTLKGYNNISTTDKLLPIINLTYVRDTVIADYVENHVTELKLTENEIKASVESVSSSVDGLNTTINRVEEITNDNSQVINVISTNIDKTSGEVREVTTTTGFTFNADGMTIDDGSGFKAQHRANGTYYKDGESIVGQYTKDGSKQKDLELFGTYSYGKESIEDTPMFVGQLYTDANGERGFGHFYNGEG